MFLIALPSLGKELSRMPILRTLDSTTRHSCASYLAQSGASLLEIADVLGHKQISVTKRYSHLCIEHKASLINRVLGGI